MISLKQLFCCHIYKTVKKTSLYEYSSVSNLTGEVSNFEAIAYHKVCLKCHKKTITRHDRRIS